MILSNLAEVSTSHGLGLCVKKQSFILRRSVSLLCGSESASLKVTNWILPSCSQCESPLSHVLSCSCRLKNGECISSGKDVSVHGPSLFPGFTRGFVLSPGVMSSSRDIKIIRIIYPYNDMPNRKLLLANNIETCLDTRSQGSLV